MPANKPVRRSQLISPWGIGHMVNFPNDESLMVCGLDAWNRVYPSGNDQKEYLISEQRLEKRLDVKELRLPPDFRDPGEGITNTHISIPFVRFPLWHYCPKCGYMVKVSLYSERQKCNGPKYSKGMSCHNSRRKPRMIPVRFIAACPRGHIEDFPFIEWVHNGQNPGTDHILRFRAGRSAGALSGIEISCICGKKKSMAGAFNVDSLKDIKKCSGIRPWLGEMSTAQGCGDELRVVQRGASNVYFPQIRTSIYLPQWRTDVKRRLIDILEENWDFLTNGTVNGQLDRNRFELVANQKGVSVGELVRAAEDRVRTQNEDEIGDSEEDYRFVEYQALLNELGGDNQDFFVTKKNRSDYSSVVSEYFSNVCLVHKLRETRALCGFTRLVPEDTRSIEDMKRDLSVEPVNWLPAVLNRGEGVFLEFDNQRLDDWVANGNAKNRSGKLIDTHNHFRIDKGCQPRSINPVFVLLHTFAHLMINRMSYQCGYGSSALRERIYCNNEHIDKRMNGVLIYTSSGDSEGSMGGVVALGRSGLLERIVQFALIEAQWCSYDPICMNSEGQGTNSCNLAACYACALLPETSCEEMNVLLDRGVVIGSHEEPEKGYFQRF